MWGGMARTLRLTRSVYAQRNEKRNIMSDSGGTCDWCPNYVENGEGRYPYDDDGDDTRICDVCYEGTI